MTQYKITIAIPNAGNKRIPITLDLGNQEDYPEDYFKQEKNVSPIKEEIEKQTLRNLTDSLLKKLIADIIQNIKLNRRSITVELDLPSAMPNSVSGTNTYSPAVTSPPSPSTPVTPKPRPRIPQPDFTKTPIADPWSDKNNQAENFEQDDSEPTIIFKPKKPTPRPSTPRSDERETPSSYPPIDDQENNTESEETKEPTVSYETATNEPDF
ncbi:MAG: hypothetical protein AB4057_01105 [Crocosphaera sp.]